MSLRLRNLRRLRLQLLLLKLRNNRLQQSPLILLRLNLLRHSKSLLRSRVWGSLSSAWLVMRMRRSLRFPVLRSASLISSRTSRCLRIQPLLLVLPPQKATRPQMQQDVLHRALVCCATNSRRERKCAFFAHTRPRFTDYALYVSERFHKI